MSLQCCGEIDAHLSGRSSNRELQVTVATGKAEERQTGIERAGSSGV